MRRILIVFTAMMFAALASAASASSIVYIKGGNVWLASSDGSNQRQVTTGGYWDSPSQADDGTILAQQGTQLYRMNRQGTLLDPAFNTVFSTAAPAAGEQSPIDPVIPRMARTSPTRR